MDIIECLEKELIIAKAKVEVITDLLVKFKPTVEETPFDECENEPQPITNNAF